MKLLIDITDIVGRSHGGTTTIPATIQLADVPAVTGPPDGDTRIEVLLDKRRVIADIWGIEDVREVRPDLTDDQAWEVLQIVRRRRNAEFGINWDFLRDTAEELYPEPDLPPDPDGKNGDRAAWAGNAVAAFREQTGTDDADVLCDLLCDLMHWADRNHREFKTALDRARDHYDAETAGGSQ